MPLTLLLPPSETKRVGGDGPALDLATLAFGELLGIRKTLVEAVTSLTDPAVALPALGITAGQQDQLVLNTTLESSPTSPALLRYTGVLYDALDVAGMSRAERRRASDRVVIASALFGAVRGGDRIPAYRLSAGSRLPGLGTLAALWRPTLAPVLAALPGLVVDLRSGAYAQLAPVPGAVTVRVLSVAPDGSRSVVSHANKHTKGLLARILATTPRAPRSPEGVARAATEAGLTVERVGRLGIDVLV